MAMKNSNAKLAPPLKTRTPSPKHSDNGLINPSDYNNGLRKSLDTLLDDQSVSATPVNGKSKTSRMRRSLTMRDISSIKRSKTTISFERIKKAKELVEDAIKKGKVFTVIGPYHRVRQILRSRGWIEKFNFVENGINPNAASLGKRSRSISKSIDRKDIEDDQDYDDDADGDFDDDDIRGDGPEPALPPWEEDDGVYGIMSRMLRNHPPNLFWSLRRSQIDCKNLRKDQIINHHGRSGYFTTKTGLARSLNQLRWFDDKEPDHFFPRCFIISNLEDKIAFIDNFRLTACIALLKCVLTNYRESSRPVTPLANANSSAGYDLSNSKTGSSVEHLQESNNSPRFGRIQPKINYRDPELNHDRYIDYKYLDMALQYCQFHLKVINHEDIDKSEFIFSHHIEWEDFLENYYKVVHEGYRIARSNEDKILEKCQLIDAEFRTRWPQYDMEGFRNVWILKPGAKSRGRGIVCYNRLSDMLKLVSNSIIIHDTRFIVQKYIERPLLIYNTKFDIRQWFMVTDWNPLTVWWYKEAYLRFCSQQFTLDDFNESVHLSNNSIQNKYLNGPRSHNLPDDNMWFWHQFTAWLKKNGHGNVAETKIMPAMKEAVIDALLCVQDLVDWRKSTFEVYGADFMISTNDMRPWLIEINSSPCMAQTTVVTAKLTADVLDDTFKVVLDKRENKNASTGKFELLYRQLAISIPPYIGIDLKLSGTTIPQPSYRDPNKSINYSSLNLIKQSRDATSKSFSGPNHGNNGTRRSIFETTSQSFKFNESSNKVAANKTNKDDNLNKPKDDSKLIQSHRKTSVGSSNVKSKSPKPAIVSDINLTPNKSSKSPHSPKLSQVSPLVPSSNGEIKTAQETSTIAQPNQETLNFLSEIDQDKEKSYEDTISLNFHEDNIPETTRSPPVVSPTSSASLVRNQIIELKVLTPKADDAISDEVKNDSRSSPQPPTAKSQRNQSPKNIQKSSKTGGGLLKTLDLSDALTAQPMQRNKRNTVATLDSSILPRDSTAKLEPSLPVAQPRQYKLPTKVEVINFSVSRNTQANSGGSSVNFLGGGLKKLTANRLNDPTNQNKTLLQQRKISRTNFIRRNSNQVVIQKYHYGKPVIDNVHKPHTSAKASSAISPRRISNKAPLTTKRTSNSASPTKKSIPQSQFLQSKTIINTANFETIQQSNNFNNVRHRQFIPSTNDSCYHLYPRHTIKSKSKNTNNNNINNFEPSWNSYIYQLGSVSNNNNSPCKSSNVFVVKFIPPIF